MLKLKTILHPTDFSERSEFAFRLACALARDHGARMIIMHVMVPPTVVYGEGIVPPDPEQSKEELRKKLGRIRPSDPAIPCGRALVEGNPVTEILHLAHEDSCDLIVMGTHGWTGLSRLLMGSVAEQIVRKATCPVLTVKTPFEVKEPARLQAAVEAEEVLETAAG